MGNAAPKAGRVAEGSKFGFIDRICPSKWRALKSRGAKPPSIFQLAVGVVDVATSSRTRLRV
jgi:hypothetical protein